MVDLSGVFLVLAAVISLGGRGLLLEKFKKAKKQEEEEESQSGIQITKWASILYLHLYCWPLIKAYVKTWQKPKTNKDSQMILCIFSEGKIPLAHTFRS